jgi:hypothetical protein
MDSFTLLPVGCVLVLAVVPSAQQSDPLNAAAAALGAAKIRSLQFTGSAANFSVGQTFTPNDPWSRVTVKNYTASINYDTGSMRQELLREMGTTMPRRGGASFIGKQRQIQVVSRMYAWNVPAPSCRGGRVYAAGYADDPGRRDRGSVRGCAV